MKLEIGKMIGCNRYMTFFVILHAPMRADNASCFCPHCAQIISPYDGQPGAPPHLGGKGGEGGSAGEPAKAMTAEEVMAKYMSPKPKA